MTVLPRDEARYRLDKYPRWAKNFILNDNDWGVFQRCIVREKFCEKRDYQGGCCSLPIYCGYQETNKTWIVPKSGLHYQDDTNCAQWSNDYDKLCYNCDTCKSYYLYKFTDKWVLRGFGICFTFFVWIGCYDCTVGAGNAKNDRRREQIV
ncbi:hypothetical protein RHMOL_Rhmol07G0243500 [Rhododendron molle]|uniref:Uncharacterized protein n=1 Tax=Rhododendron molle TaxID=49168 RepID=A0ACC0N476_RHOML|nr:hypothetical protein RHMOL_Rhmol07G0243500 [Rhododendron molle]